MSAIKLWKCPECGPIHVLDTEGGDAPGRVGKRFCGRTVTRKTEPGHAFKAEQRRCGSELEQVTLLPLELVPPVVRALDQARRDLYRLGGGSEAKEVQAALDHLLAQAPELKGGDAHELGRSSKADARAVEPDATEGSSEQVKSGGPSERCPRCKGNGRIEMLEHCPECHGDGTRPTPAHGTEEE